MEADNDNLKSQMGALTDKISKASKRANARFKRQKIRSMKREVDKINEKLAASKAKLESVKPRVTIDPIQGAPLKLHPSNKSKRIEVKISKIYEKLEECKTGGTKNAWLLREKLYAQN